LDFSQHDSGGANGATTLGSQYAGGRSGDKQIYFDSLGFILNTSLNTNKGGACAGVGISREKSNQHEKKTVSV